MGAVSSKSRSTLIAGTVVRNIRSGDANEGTFYRKVGRERLPAVDAANLVPREQLGLVCLLETL
jgi:hypothetical protein